MPGRSQISSADNRYKFTGKERDTETNYDYLGARYYDSRIARWLQVDPLAEKYPGWSPYNYTLNNPIIFIDPDGKEVKGARVTTWRDVRNEWNQTVKNAANAPFMLRAPTFIMGAIKTVATIVDAVDPLGLTGVVGTISSTGEKLITQMLNEGEIVSRNGKLYSSAKGINTVGKDLNFSKLESIIKDSKPAKWHGELTGGIERIVKYVDADGNTIAVVHEITDASGSIVHRDFDAVRTNQGMVNKEKALNMNPGKNINGN